MDRKIIARFPSLLEAEAAVNCLEAGGVPALVDNSVTGGMLPHASDALGGFTVSVEDTNEAEAHLLLKGIDADSAEPAPSAEAPSSDHEVAGMMKRAAYGAVLGCIILPLIANVGSLYLFFKAWRRDPRAFFRHRGIFLVGMIFNLLVLGAIAVVIYFSVPRPARHADASQACFRHDLGTEERLASCAELASVETDRRLRESAFGTMGVLHARNRHFDLAILEFSHALNLNASNESAYLYRGYAYAFTGDVGHALADFNSAILADTYDPAPRIGHCFLTAIAGRLEEARKDCDDAVALGRASPADEQADMYDTRGFVNWKAGRYKAALSDFDAAVSRNPKQATSLYGRGLSRNKLGDKAVGDKDISEAIRIQPTVEKDFGTLAHIIPR